jgi:hypothetical protein
MALKVKKTQSLLIDEGDYIAVISMIQKQTHNRGDYYRWTFIVKDATKDDEPLEGIVKVTGLTSDSFSEQSNLGKWAKAAGLDTDEDEIDLEDAFKRVVRIYIEDRESKDGRTWSTVTKVKPYKKKKNKNKNEEIEEVEDDTEDEAPKETKKKTKKSKTKKKDKEEAADAPSDDDDDILNDDDLFGDLDDD